MVNVTAVNGKYLTFNGSHCLCVLISMLKIQSM